MRGVNEKLASRSEAQLHPLDDGLRLQSGHPLFWMEEYVKTNLGYISSEHEQDHVEMMEYFKLEYRNFSPLNGWLINNEIVNSRERHFLLHLVKWKAEGTHKEAVERAEKLYDLENVPLPEVPKDG